MRTLFIGIFLALMPLYASGQVTFIESADDLNISHLDDNRGCGILDIDNNLIDEIAILNLYGVNRLYYRQGFVYADIAPAYAFDYTYYDHSITVADVNFDYLPDYLITGSENGLTARLMVNNFPYPFVDQGPEYNLESCTGMGAVFFQMTPASGLSVLTGTRLLNLRNGSFVDITQGSGFENLNNVFCPVFFDIDGDFDDDLFIAGNWELNYGTLFRNNGDGTFTDISTNTNQGGFGFGQSITFGDIENDGDFDVYLSSGFGINTMWANDGSGFFTNVTQNSNTGFGGYSRGANFADFDNDGDVDLFVQRAEDYKLLLLNDGTGVFTDYSNQGGVNLYGGGGACAVGDLNNDGQLDIIATNSDNYGSQVFINQNQDTSYIKVKVVGRNQNTQAIGAIVQLFRQSGSTSLYLPCAIREISSHPSAHSVNDLVVHFGTGDGVSFGIRVHFQSLAVKETTGVAPGSFIILEEPDPTSIEVSPLLPINTVTVTAYPNPFNSSCAIKMKGGEQPYYELAIYDMLGRKIKSARVINNLSSESIYMWHGDNDNGDGVPSGVYFARVKSGNLCSRIKISLIK